MYRSVYVEEAMRSSDSGVIEKVLQIYIYVVCSRIARVHCICGCEKPISIKLKIVIETLLHGDSNRNQTIENADHANFKYRKKK